MGFITQTNKPRVFVGLSKMPNKKGDMWAYFTVKNKETGEVLQYNGFQGKIIRLEKREDTFEGKPMPKLCVVFDGDGKDIVIQIGFYSGAARDVLLKLPPDFYNHTIALIPYCTESNKNKGDYYSHISVKINGEKAQWQYKSEDVPEVEYVLVGSKNIPNPEKRDAFFDDLFLKLQSGMPKQNITYSEEVDTDNDDEDLDAAHRVAGLSTASGDNVDIPF